MPHCHCIAFYISKKYTLYQFNNLVTAGVWILLHYYTILESFFSHNILDRRTDRDPEMMAKVFRSPGEYLPGPDSIPELRRDMQHFVIVGGGAAGLVSAYTLLRLGHKVGRYQTLKTGHLFPHLDGWVL